MDVGARWTAHATHCAGKAEAAGPRRIQSERQCSNWAAACIVLAVASRSRSRSRSLCLSGPLFCAMQNACIIHALYYI